MGRFSHNTRNGGGAKKDTVKKKKTLEDYFVYVGSSKQTSDYEVIANFVINHIKKTFDYVLDISEALRTLKEPDTDLWKTKLQASKLTDAAERAVEDRQFGMDYKAVIDETTRRTRELTGNRIKSYALLWERCAKAMQNKILERSDYESDVYNNPIKLRQSIKQHALNFDETQYTMTIITNSISAFFATVQKENEPLSKYTRRFRTAKEIMESHLGEPLSLKKVVEGMKGYVEEKKHAGNVELQQKAADRLYAYLHLKNASQSKYGQVLKNLNYDQSLGKNDYPDNITGTAAVLSHHSFDVKKKREDRKKHNNNNDKEDPVTLSFAQMEGRCYCCGKANHRSDECRQRDKIPKLEWAIKKGKTEDNSQSHAQFAEMNASQLTTNNNNSEAHVGWASVQVKDYSFLQGSSMREWVLLDSDSTHTIFCYPEYVTDIVDVDETLNLGTNWGVLVSDQKCNVAGLGQRWYNKNAIANVISLADVVNYHRVRYDSHEGLAFLVHTGGKIVKFHQLKSGLYARIPKMKEKPTEEQATQFFNVGESLRYLSRPQKARVMAANKMLHALGAPTLADLKSVIRMNFIRNNTVFTEDVT